MRLSLESGRKMRSKKKKKEYLEKKLGQKIKHKFAPWRPGDQKYFVSNNTKLKKFINWKPKFDLFVGVSLLLDWLSKNIKELYYNV
jgi:UDP-glucose 4-epimerase